MKLGLTHVRLLVTDFGKSYRFYRDVVGLKPRFSVDENGVYEEFAAGSVTLAIFTRAAMAQAVKTSNKPPMCDAQDAVCLTFEVDDVDAAHAALQSKGVEFVNPPHDQPAWMIRVAHFRDPDGNLIEVNQPLGRE